MTSVSPPTLSTPPTPPTPPARTHNSGPSPSSPATPTSSQLERRMSERPIIIPVRPPPPPPPRSAHLYQGETFVINERSYFIWRFSQSFYYFSCSNKHVQLTSFIVKIKGYSIIEVLIISNSLPLFFFLFFWHLYLLLYTLKLEYLFGPS